MRAVLVGAGAVGARVARQLIGNEGCELAVVEPNDARRGAVVQSLGQRARAASWSTEALAGADVVVLAHPGAHRPDAEAALEHGAHVVSVTDRLRDARSLLALDAEARERGRSVTIGAGFSPGMTCLLARHASAEFDEVREIHVAKVGTGGPACARSRHDALAASSLDHRDGAWVERRSGSGRELCWFPDPVGGQDCYRAALPDALLLVPAFPGVGRVTARLAASRRDRLTSRLPMLRPPHPEGLLGAVRVEVRGLRGGSSDVRVLGVLDRPAVAAGVLAGIVAEWAVEGRLARAGAAGLAELVPEPAAMLHELARRGVRAAAFEGCPT